MASHTPIIVQNEKLTIHQGIHGVKGGDLSKPAKTVRQDRKALSDISNVGKQPLRGAAKSPTLKEKSVARVRGKTTKKASYYSFLSEEDVKRCHKWAKEGIERTHFTGNDMQNHLKDMQEKRVKKKVEKVMSALHEWSNMPFELGMPVKELAKDTEDVMKLDLETEVLPPTSLPSTSGHEEIEDLLFEPELYDFPSLGHTFDELKLKEDDADVTCF